MLLRIQSIHSVSSGHSTGLQSTWSNFNKSGAFTRHPLGDALGSPNSQFIEISWHLIDLRVVVILDLLKEASVTGQNEVDGCSLSSETTSTADSVDVVLLLLWQLEIDDKTDLLDINTTGKHIGGDQDSHGT
jgi:hypothetical protein